MKKFITIFTSLAVAAYSSFGAEAETVKVKVAPATEKTTTTAETPAPEKAPAPQIITLEHAPSLNVMSLNIHYPKKKDHQNGAWEKRKTAVLDMLRFYDTDIIFFQDISKPQMRDVLALGEFDVFSFPPNRTLAKFQGNAIAWRKDRLELLESGRFWLGEDPEAAVPAWGALDPRNATWAKFKDRATGKIFFAFNTKLDDRSDIARDASAKLILAKMAEIGGESPKLLAVDFTGISPKDSVAVFETALSDTAKVSEAGHYGPAYSFHNFTGRLQNDTPDTLCVVFTDKKSGIKVYKHASLSDNRNSVYPSDYFPILTEIELK